MVFSARDGDVMFKASKVLGFTAAFAMAAMAAVPAFAFDTIRPVRPSFDTIRPVSPAFDTIRPVKPAFDTIRPVKPAFDTIRPVKPA